GAFSLYRYIPHNTLLWLWLLGGLVGFTILWMPLLIGSFFALRAHRAARSADERTIALTCVAVLIAHQFQIYADMGTQYWMSVILVPAALAMTGKLAITTGAWPRDA
ncbi:MAG: polymerase, partial [Polyangiaceae bacterium]|nr:polymerase [Polyangiaceae bacterium]